MTATAAEQHITQISHHIDAAEEIAEAEFFTISGASPLALENLLARLKRLQSTIEIFAATASK